jgi:ribonuclease R
LNETGASGFVPAATLGAEYFRFKPAEHAMTGDRTGISYRLGDAVTVRLAEAAPIAGALRFEILAEGGKRQRTGTKAVRATRPADPKRRAFGPRR